MGLIVGLGSVFYMAITVSPTLNYVEPAASLSNAWDTRVGGALADSISRNAVVNGRTRPPRERE